MTTSPPEPLVAFTRSIGARDSDIAQLMIVERSGGAEVHAQTLRRGPYYFVAPTGPSRAIVRV